MYDESVIAFIKLWRRLSAPDGCVDVQETQTHVESQVFGAWFLVETQGNAGVAKSSVVRKRKRRLKRNKSQVLCAWFFVNEERRTKNVLLCFVRLVAWF